MSKLVSCDYPTTHYNVVKCCRNVKNRLILNIREKKMIGFGYYEEYYTFLIGYYEEYYVYYKYTKQNILMTVLRKNFFHSVEI